MMTETRTVRCGNRKVHGAERADHETTAQVALCCKRPGGIPSIQEEAARVEAVAAEQPAADEMCEHQMSAWLCAGPNHYPSAEQERADSSEWMTTSQLMSAAASQYHARGEGCPWDCANCPGNREAEEYERSAELADEANAAQVVVPEPDTTDVMAALTAAGFQQAQERVEVQGALEEMLRNGAAETATVITKAEHPPWDGLYTIENPTSGLPHRTFRLRTQDADDKFAPGRQIIAYLSGPNNERDYTGFGFVDRNALGYFVKVWKRHQDNQGVQRDAEQLLLDPDAYLTEAKCIRCHRTLTVPASVHQGYGSECIKRV